VFSFEVFGFCFPGFAEYFLEDVLTEPMTPSIDGVGRALEVLGLRESGK